MKPSIGQYGAQQQKQWRKYPMTVIGKSMAFIPLLMAIPSVQTHAALNSSLPNALAETISLSAASETHVSGVLLGLVVFSLCLAAFMTFSLWRLRREHRRLEQDLHQSQQFQHSQQAILEAIPDLLFEVDLEGKFFECYSLRSDLLMAPGDELIGRNVREIMPPDAAETLQAALRVANAKGLSTGKEIVLPLAEGKRWYGISVSRKSRQPNEPPRFIVVTRDITTHKKLEIALGESERHFRSLIENWPDEIARYDAECRRVYVNPAMKSSIGGQMELLGRTPTESYPSSLTVNFFERKLREVLKTGVTQDLELQWDYPTSIPMFRSLRLVPEHDEFGAVVGVFAIARDISEAKRMESVLRESERQFRTLAEHLPDNVCRLDCNMIVTYINAQFAATLRVKAQDVIGKRIPGTEDDGEFLTTARRVLETGSPGELEIVLPDVGYGERFHHVRFVAERSEAGKIMGVLAIGRDLTERKRLENDLQVREQYQRALLDNFPFMVWLKDTDSRLLAVNRSYLKAAGLPASAPYFGLTDLDLFPLEHAEKYRADDREVMQSGKQKTVEELVGTADNLRWHETGKTPVFDESGQLLGTVGYARDITLQKEARAALIASERQFRTLAENAPDNICRYDRDCRIIYMNPVLEETLQIKLADARGKTPTQLQAESFYEDYERRLRRVIATGEPDEHELIMPDVGDGAQHHLILLAVERDDSGEIVGALAIGRNITNLKRAEADLHAREQQFRTLTENVPDVIARFDTECRYVYCNPRLLGMAGKSEEEVLGKTPAAFLEEEQAAILMGKVQEVIRTRRESDLILLVPPRNGRPKIHDHIRFVPEFDADGQLGYVLAIGRDISALKEIERQFATLLENMPDFVSRLDPEGRHLYVSPGVCKGSGLPMEHFLGKTILELSLTGEPENDRLLHEDALRCAREGIQISREMVFRSPAGENLILVLFVPERDETDHIVSVLTVSRDITEQKHAEEALAMREREFRTLAENTPDALVRFDKNFRRIYFNRAYLLEAGVDVEQALGKTPLEYWFVLSPTAEEYMVYLRRVMRTGKTEELIFETPRPNGEKSYQVVSLVPEYDANGQPAGILIISRDITGIKRMEAMLRKSEQEFRTLAENSPEMIVRYDRDCRCIYINPAYEQETGTPLGQAWNTTPLENWKPLMSPLEYMARLRRVMESGQPDRILLEWVGEDGQLVSHEMHAVAEYDDNGMVSSVLVMGHNITALKATARRLEESQAQIRAMTAQREAAREEERKRIAREIHDELGQLLSVLRLNVTTLDYLFGDKNADLRTKTGTMVTTVDRAITMVRNLATRLRPAVLDAGLGPALEWMVQEFSQSTGIQCEVHLLEEDMGLDADRAMVVFRIVQESLTNILRHSGANHVDITMRKEGSHCEVLVQDNGQGFDPGAGRRNSFGIVGMKERALMLNGDMTISSEKGKGTLVRVRIPIAGC